MFSATIDGVHILPVLHEKLEYGDLARRAFDELQPDAVAVEIPSSLEKAWLRAVQRLPRISIVLYENDEGRTIYLPVQPADPLTEAARLALAAKIPIKCVDLDVDGYADYRDHLPDAYALMKVAPSEFHEAVIREPRRRDAQDDRREAAMSYQLQQLREEGAQRILLLCGMHHAAGIAERLSSAQAIPLTPPDRAGVRLVHPHPESLAEVLSEIPYHVACYERRRLGLPETPEPSMPIAAGRDHGPFRILSGGRGDAPDRVEDSVVRAARAASDEMGRIDRLRLQWALIEESDRALSAASPDEQLQGWQRRALARFTRNLAHLSGRLVVDLFDLLAAARGCVSDNFAWELHRLATAYPAQDEQARDLPTVRIRADEMFDGVRRIRLQRRSRKPKKADWRSLLKRKRRNERYPGEWLEGFDDTAICSYPPEDILIEDFGRYLRGKGKHVLSEEQSRVVPFTTSVLDGIDVRETIRQWHAGKIMVRELGRAPGEVGSVVVILEDEDVAEDARFPYCQTWHGEHEQESDMAFYCTDPAQGIVGPGICRATYGGFLLSYPPRRMADVWADADYRPAESKAEVLLLAAMDYSTEPLVVYVAAQPPRPILRQLAARMELKIVYLPLGSLSPTTLKKIRVMHILSGHDKRDLAPEYIW